MIKILSAYTRELEDSAKAVQEILEQLDLGKKQRKHSVGLLFCHTEFIEFGVMEAICKSLSFDVIGCTSQGFAVNSAKDEIMLVLNVLTSDDIRFAAGLSGPLTEDSESRIESCYRGLESSLDEKPSLIFALEPRLLEPSGDVLTAALDRACNGIPVFGTVALDINKKTMQAKTIYNGVAWEDRMTLLLFSGPVNPRFFSVLIPKKDIFPQNAIISEVKGNRIYSINNISALAFLTDMGLLQSDALEMSYVIPLIVEYPDREEPEILVIEKVADDGSLICGKKTKVGGILNIGSLSAGYVIESAAILARAIKAVEGRSGLFIISCFSRSVILGGELLAEIHTISSELADFSIPWLFFYSGGEICPQHTKNGKTINRYMQYSITACLL
jgi:hypothetical protein